MKQKPKTVIYITLFIVGIIIYSYTGTLQALIDGFISKKMYIKCNSHEIALPENNPLVVIALKKAGDAKEFRTDMVIPFLEKLCTIQNLHEAGKKVDGRSVLLPSGVIFDVAFSNMGEEGNRPLYQLLSTLNSHPQEGLRIPTGAVVDIESSDRGKAIYGKEILCNSLASPACFSALGRGIGRSHGSLGRKEEDALIQSISLKEEASPPWAESNFIEKKCDGAGPAENILFDNYPYNITFWGYTFLKKKNHDDIDPDKIIAEFNNLLPLTYFKEVTPTIDQFDHAFETGSVIYLDSRRSVQNLNPEVLSRKLGDRVIFIGGIEPSDAPEADIRTTLYGKTNGLFIHPNGLLSLYYADSNLKNYRRPVLIKYGFQWETVGLVVFFILFIIAMHVKLYRWVDRMKQRFPARVDNQTAVLQTATVPAESPRISSRVDNLIALLFSAQADNLTAVAQLIAASVVFLCLYIVLATLCHAIIYDVSIIFAVIFFTVWMMRMRIKNSIYYMVGYLNPKCRRLTKLIGMVNEKRKDVQQIGLFDTTHKDFNSDVLDSVQLIGSEPDFKYVISALYKWFYDGSGALNRFPEEFKVFGLDVKILRLFHQHNLSSVNTDEEYQKHCRWHEEVLLKYTGEKDDLLPDDTPRFTMIQKKLLDGIDELLRSLIKHYEKKNAEKIAAQYKREAERNIVPIINEDVRRKICDKFPERGTEIIEAISSCPDKKDMGKKLAALGLAPNKVKVVFRCIYQPFQGNDDSHISRG